MELALSLAMSSAALLSRGVAAAGPVNTVAPVISGTTTQGELLTTTDGTWTGSPTSYAYQWKRDAAAISGATAQSYVLVAGDVTHSITCTVTATNGAGSTAATSNSLGPVTGLTAPTLTTAPSIAGTGGGGTANPTDIEGTIITATPGVYAGSPSVLTGQWQRGGVDISGETGLTYQTTATDVGAVIRYRETATNGAGAVGPTASSNTLTIKNGYLFAFGVRASSTAANARSSYFSGADNGTTVSRNPAAGPAGPYSMGSSGSISFAGAEEPAFGNNLIGYAAISGSGGRFFAKGLPLNVPLDIATAMGGLGYTSATTGASFYDGDPDTVGVLLFTQSALVQGDEVVDASGAVIKANVWDATNIPRTITLTNGRTGGLGEIWVRQNGSSNVIYFRYWSVKYHSFAIELGGVGPYYVLGNGLGDNTKNGKSLANAWANFPGDPNAVGGAVKDFILLPGAVVNLEGGQTHKPASFTSRTTWMFQKAPGTSTNPIKIQPRAGSGKAIIDGSEDLPFATAVTSGDVYGNLNAASITTHVGAPNTSMIKAPVCAGKPLRPCTWPKAGDITAYDFSDSGSDAYWPEDTTTGPGGSAPLFVTGAADSGGAGYRKVTYSGPKVLARYGSVSLVGYPIHCRFVGNQIFGKTITAHNTATGSFTFNIANDPATEELYSPAGVSGFQDFLWQIRYHPFDILEEGQYGYSTILSKHVGWFPASGQRGLIRLDRFLTSVYDDWQFIGGADGIQVRNLMGSEAYVCKDGSGSGVDRLVFKQIEVRGTSDEGRNYLWELAGGGSGWTFEDIDIADNFTKGGIAVLKSYSGSGTRIKIRESGRTGIYNGGPSPNQSTDFTWTDLDISDWSGIHANAATVYQDAQRIKILGLTAVNHVRPSTSQGYTNNFSRANEIARAILIGRLQPSGAPRVVSHIVQTNDNNGTDSFWHHAICAEAEGMLLGPNSAGMRVENYYATKIGDSAANYISGIAFTNCLFGTGGVLNSVSDLTSNGATCTNVAFTGSGWDGTITAAIRQKLTANGVLGTYSDVTLGDSRKPWFVPAYGTSFALQDCILSSPTVRRAFQAGEPFAQVLNTSPESSISLPAGVGGSNNSLFTMTRGKIAFAASPIDPVGTTYNLDVKQDNASADRAGPSSKTTRFVITLV